MSDKLSAISDQLSAKQAISYQLSAISLNRAPKGSPNTEGNGSTGLRCVVFLGSPYGAPAHRKVPGERPEGGADRMSAPDLRGRMPRKISAGTRNRGCAGVVAPSGVSFLLVTLLWTSKEESPWVGQPPTSNTPPAGRLDPNGARDMSDILKKLAETLESRKGADPASSYVAGLYAKG